MERVARLVFAIHGPIWTHFKATLWAEGLKAAAAPAMYPDFQFQRPEPGFGEDPNCFPFKLLCRLWDGGHVTAGDTNSP